MKGAKTMDLYLMRHAEAVDLGVHGITRDADRALTDKGQRQAMRMGRLLKKLGVKFDMVLSSPFVRARDTAKRMLQEMDVSLKITNTDALKPDGKNDAIWQTILRAESHSILIVGHLPSIASFAASLMGNLSDEPLHFHKGTLAALRYDPDAHMSHATVEWMVSAAFLKRALSRSSREGTRPRLSQD